MRLAICQINPVIGDFEYNSVLITDAAGRARQAGCDLAVFPEMAVMGYPAKDLLENRYFIDQNLKSLEDLAARTEGIGLLCGYVDRNPCRIGKPLVNSVALIRNGTITGKGGKRLLPSYDVFDETRYFEPAGESLVFQWAGRRCGVTICEDIWNVQGLSEAPLYGVEPVSDLQRRGIDILINISASPYTIDKGSLRLRILQNLARACRCPAVYCNQVGGNDELLFDGSSMVVDARGRLIRLGRQFESDLLVWDLDREYAEIPDPWPQIEASVLKGIIMGTGDYARKCGFTRALVGLSGGIDSSLVAYIACEALGPENVTGVSMPSPYTSRMSREDARKLAENLAIRFEEIPISDLFSAYKETLKPVFKGLEEDETEENIQARIRGNLIMALSNKFKALLLTTGNKSEFAMGYCTLYGDLSGGLAVISDIPKTLCYRLARFINRDREIIPQRVLTRPPSAELKPGQTDQDTLPPYEVLDDIIEAATEKKMGFRSIVARGHDPAVVESVLRRMAFNEYKRRQAPPGLKITSKAFGYGWRYPIAKGKQVY
jgi:NAD+ synthase (glutamine-hydrolysing)